MYGTILKSWIGGIDWVEWLKILSNLTGVFFRVFLYTGFQFIPILAIFATMLISRAFSIKKSHDITCLSLFISVVVVFFVNNAAPPYQSIRQLRGDWIARIYEPVFVVYIILIALAAQIIYNRTNYLKGTLFLVLFIECIIGNGIVAVWIIDGRKQRGGCCRIINEEWI